MRLPSPPRSGWSVWTEFPDTPVKKFNNIPIVHRLPVFIKLWGSPGMDATEKATTAEARGWALAPSHPLLQQHFPCAASLLPVRRLCNASSAICSPALAPVPSAASAPGQTCHFTDASNLCLKPCFLQCGNGAGALPWAVSLPQLAFSWSSQHKYDWDVGHYRLLSCHKPALAEDETSC